MTPSASRRIFVSHSHQDNDFGLKLVQELQNALGDETAVWYDTAGGLQGGDPWWSKIKQELKACSVFLVVLSPDAIASKWVNDEINIAWKQKNSPTGKHIIPILYSACEVPEDLETLQIISFLPPNSYEQAFKELLKALSITLEREILTVNPDLEPLPSLGPPSSISPAHISTAYSSARKVISNSWRSTPLFIGLALLIVGSLALFSLRANSARLSSTATATALANLHITATAAALAYAVDTSKVVMFGFDPAHSRWNRSEHVLNTTNITHLKLDWTYVTGGGIRSSPTIANGLVYFGSRDSKLYAFDASCTSNCKPLWTYLTGDVVGSSPAVANGRVYVGSHDGKLYVFDAACRSSCTPLWTYAADKDIASSPAVAGGMVYVGSYDSNLYAFD
ncbi:MAG: toll/interleukin-1 receptor domain-containing protein, partial [Chloroflexi bacterium]